MQFVPLTVSQILEYGEHVHGTTTVSTWMNDTVEDTTFMAIGARAAAFAHALDQDLGVTGDERVATFMWNCAEHLEVFFATSCKGAVFHPLNKQLMHDQIAHVINHAEDQVVVVDPKLAEKLGQILSSCPLVKHVVVIGAGEQLPDLTVLKASFPPHITLHGYEQLLDGKPSRYLWPELPEDTAAAMCYSTGTTGAPKGVVYSHRSIYLHAMNLRTTDSFAVSHGEKFLCCVPIYHVLSWGVPIAAFMSGTPLVFPGDNLSAPQLAKIIATSHPRAAHGVPTLWISLMVHYIANPPERMSLTEIFVGGSPAPPILISMWEERYGVDVIHVWGMTETSPIGTVSRPPSGVSGKNRTRYRISQGRFPAPLQFRVIADETEVTGTDRNDGEIQVRGPWVAGSYYHSPQEDPGGLAATFRGHHVDNAPQYFTEDGWLRTGDVGSVTSDGYLTIKDRARDVIRSGGEWIFSAQLENLVMEAPVVIEAAVIGYPDPKWGERPLAVTVLAKEVARSPEADRETAERLRNRLRTQLPSWMLPEYWTFVDSIDKTSVDKFDKKDLRKHLANGDFTIIKLKGPGEA